MRLPRTAGPHAPAVPSSPGGRRQCPRCRQLARTVAAERNRAGLQQQRHTPRSGVSACATASRSAETQVQVVQPVPGRDLIDWLGRIVPWERIGVWLVVAVAALNLKDFFGARAPRPPALPEPRCGCLRRGRAPARLTRARPAAQIAMGKFILAFIGNGFVRSAQRLTEGATMLEPLPPTWQRRLFVVVYFAAIVSCVTLFGVMVRRVVTPQQGRARLRAEARWQCASSAP